MNYYRRYSGDYLRDTARLNLTEHGAYTLLMDYYYSDEKPLPVDHGELFLMVRAMRPEDQAAVEKVLSIYFTKRQDGYHQKRIDKEIQVAKQARENGTGGGRPKTKTPTGQITGTKTEKLTEEVTGQGTEGKAGDITGTGHPPTAILQPPAASPQEKALSADADMPAPSGTACPHMEIVDLYNEILPMGVIVQKKLWKGTRQKHLQARWREDKDRQSLDWWRKFFDHCAESKWLTGQVPPQPGRTQFQVDLGWILNAENFRKILEGFYNR